MNSFQLEIPSHVALVVRHLPPDLKRSLRSALRALCVKPELGEPLVGALEGLWKYRVRRYRIVYSIDRTHRLLRVLAVGHRRAVYEDLTEQLGRRPESG